MADCAAAGGVAGATVCTTGARVGVCEFSVVLSVLLVGAFEDSAVEAVLAELALFEVDDGGAVDEPAAEPAELAVPAVPAVPADGPDDRPADELGVEPDGPCELVTVVVVSTADCSGAASGERVDGAVASALVPSPTAMTAAAMAATAARVAAPSGPMRRARSTAINASMTPPAGRGSVSGPQVRAPSRTCGGWVRRARIPRSAAG
jgi:hypothetical protein